MRVYIKTLSVASALALAACTGASQNVKVGGPEVADHSDKSSGAQNNAATSKDGKPASNEPQLPQVSSRSKLYFDDAMKEWEKQKQRGPQMDYAALESKFQKVADEDPRFAEAYYNLGVLAERQRKTDKAVEYYQLALKNRPTLKQAAENLGVIQQNKGDVQGAVEIFMKILEVYPDDGPARARLAEIYRQNGEYDRAVEFAREALVRDPKSLQAYKVLMLANLDRKQLSMAKLVALRALKLDENDPELYHTIGLILLQENEPAKARVQFQKAAEVRPDYQPAQVMLAKIALQGEDYPGAEEHLRRILQADGRNAAAMVDLGVAYKGQGQYDKAMQAYDAAEKIDPKLASVQFNRGVILGDQKKEYAKAIEYFKKFINQSEGGENGVPADHPVFQQIRLNEERISKAEADARAAEEAKKAEAEALKEAERMEAEAKAQEAAAKKAEADAKNGGDVKQASGKEEPDAKPAVEKKEEKKKEEPKKEEKKPAPTKTPAVEEKKMPSSDEPTDEPLDG